MNREVANLDPPPGCSCHPDDRPPECQREHGATHCQLTWSQKELTRLRSENERLREALGCQAGAEQGEAAHRATRSSNDRCGEAEEWAECGFGICVDCGAGLIDDFQCLRCKWQERRRMGLRVWRPCDCHNYEQQVCDLCQGMPKRIRRPDEERSVSEAMSATSEPDASLTHENEAIVEHTPCPYCNAFIPLTFCNGEYNTHDVDGTLYACRASRTGEEPSAAIGQPPEASSRQ